LSNAPVDIEQKKNPPLAGRRTQINAGQRRIDWAVYAGWALLFILALTTFTPFYQRFFIEMMIFAILAMSMDLTLGFTGLLNLSHALFFGFNIYVLAILLTNFEWPLLLAVLAALLLTLLLALIIGYLSSRLHGIQFAMVTLAFVELIYIFVMKWRNMTGGSDGKRIAREAAEFSLGGLQINMSDTLPLLFFVSALFLASYYALRRIVNSAFGNALVAVRENEERAKFLGYNIFRLKLQAFVVSSLFSALAGVGYAFLKMYISPEYVSWTLSGDVLIMTLLGGAGTLVGPIVGAMGLVWFKDWVSSYTEHWMLIVGLLFMLVVTFMPKGVLGWLFRK